MKLLIKPRAITAAEAANYDIPVKWEMEAVLSVPAYSLEQAIKYINRKEYSLPEGTLVADSYEIDYDRLEG